MWAFNAYLNYHLIPFNMPRNKLSLNNIKWNNIDKNMNKYKWWKYILLKFDHGSAKHVDKQIIQEECCVKAYNYTYSVYN